MLSSYLGELAKRYRLSKLQQLLLVEAQSLVERSLVSRRILQVKKLITATAIQTKSPSIATANKLIDMLSVVINNTTSKNIFILKLRIGIRVNRLF